MIRRLKRVASFLIALEKLLEVVDLVDYLVLLLVNTLLHSQLAS